VPHKLVARSVIETGERRSGRFCVFSISMTPDYECVGKLDKALNRAERDWRVQNGKFPETCPSSR